jgi:hypothetical protein
VAYAFAERFDNASRFAARDERQRNRVQPCAFIDIEEVEPDRSVPNEDLVTRGCAKLDRFPLQNLGPSMSMDADCIRHRSTAC